MLFDIDFDSDDQQDGRNVVRAVWTRPVPRPMRITLFEGDVSRTGAEGICTSTNGRLSLMAGSGGDVLSRGGWGIKRECEAILERHREQTGETELPAGSVRTTNAGRLSAKAVIHCVASDESHRSSSEIIRACVISALSAAVDASCQTIAMPVFGSGHAAFRFEDALETMIGVLSATAEEIDEVVIAVLAHERVHKARAILDRGTFQTSPGWGRREI